MEKTKTEHTNRLIHEQSPYLLQHAHNPVDWYPWCDEAFDKARAEDKPIFLSIGYSTCHWCHVMERESFEDEDVAQHMNNTFICIKVDREERPDIDDIYMTVCQTLTGQGGWPLTILMTPDKKPFFAGTYLPKYSSHSRMGMLDLCRQIRDVWANKHAEVFESADEIVNHIQSRQPEQQSAAPDIHMIHQAFEEFSNQFDRENGGFGDAPKFPTPHNLLFLLRYSHSTGNDTALDMVKSTLEHIRLGGMYDHIGFGFHRYSTDTTWLVPHFEKMLYDQALLMMAFTEAYEMTRDALFSTTVRELFTYISSKMTHPDGGFYSAEDADSEGEEGKFYVWDSQEIDEIAGKDSDLFKQIFNIEHMGNYDDEATRRPTGKNILHLTSRPSTWAQKHNLDHRELERTLESIRKRMAAERDQRIHPHKDDKILTDWNGLMIAALAKAGRALGEQSLIEAAELAFHFIKDNLIQDGLLLHRYRNGQAGIPGFIDDYAFVIWGLIELQQATQKVDFLKIALDLQDKFHSLFWDDKHGGYYSAAKNGEQLLVRKKNIYDGAIPSGNSVALQNLLRLSRLTGNPVFESNADHLMRAFSSQSNHVPSAHAFFVAGVHYAIDPSYEVVVVGNPESRDTRDMLGTLYSHYLPRMVSILKSTKSASDLDKIAEYTLVYKSIDGKATAYVCQNYSCQQPTTDPHVMLKQLGL